jgi:hypothetical protein
VAEPSARDRTLRFLGALQGNAARVQNESELAEIVARVFTEAGLPFEREVRLNERDRIDMLGHGGVGIEFKIDGSAANLIRQLDRYASCAEISSLLVVTTRRRLASLPNSLREKPVLVACMGSL